MQAIGGVNEKIEGFFDVCAARGLAGTQGVVIPRSNVQHLMLEQPVIDACREGRFQVYAAGSLDEVLELMCGLPAGARQPDGGFEPGSVNERVRARLGEFAEAARAQGPGQPGTGGESRP
jgi:predicted ATP-dependent protease